MVTITNTDSRVSREAEIVTTANNALNWCVATWPAPDIGPTGSIGYQIVKRQANGKYTYNDTMMHGYRDSIEAIRQMAKAAAYEVL